MEKKPGVVTEITELEIALALQRTIGDYVELLVGAAIAAQNDRGKELMRYAETLVGQSERVGRTARRVYAAEVMRITGTPQK